MLIVKEDSISLNIEKLNKIVLYQDEYFIMRKMVFETSDVSIEFEQYSFDPNIPLVNKVFQLKKFLKSFHVLY